MATNLPYQINTEDDLTQMFKALGPTFHPDENYIDQLTKEEREMSDQDQLELAARVNALVERAFELFGDRVYEIGARVIEESLS